MGNKKRWGRGQSGQIDWLSAFEAVTFGVLGLHPWHVERYTLNQLYNKWVGVMATEQDRTIENMANLRVQVAAIYNAAGADPKLQPTDVFKLPGETAPQLNRAELAKRDAAILKWAQKHKTINA